MAALSKKLSKINISLQYDAITIYPTTKPTKNETEVLTSFIDACCKLKYINTDNVIYECFEDISKSQLFDRSIHRNDPDHNLYHQDNFDFEDNHFHLKCKSMLNQKKLSDLLEIGKKFALITEAEKNEILADFDKKYKMDMQVIVAALVKNKSEIEAIKDIHQYIKSCNDLDTLIYFHQELLDSQYAYLRTPDASLSSSWWNGLVTQDGTVGRCSKAWADIEKSLELQMVHIFDTICPNITPAMGTERAAELRSDYSFFGKKHHIKDGIEAIDNSTYTALQAGYTSVIKEKYMRHFEKMSAAEVDVSAPTLSTFS